MNDVTNYQKKPKIDGNFLYRFTRLMYQTDEVTLPELLHAMIMINPISYIERNHTVKGHGVTFDIANHNYSKAGGHRPWQKAILRAMCNPYVHDVSVMKSRQLGISEVGVETLLYLMDRMSCYMPKFLYLFPTQRQMDGFLKSRIKPELENPYYNSLVDHNDDSMQQFVLRHSTAMFRTGSTSRAVEGVDIDCLLMDEYEHYADTSAEVSALESLKSSKFGMIRRWSTPSAPEIGIDLRYRESDQHVWRVRCSHCGLWQTITFHNNLFVVDPSEIDKQSRQANPGACQYLCRRCHHNLENDRWYNGRWFCKYPHRNKPEGFFISQLDAVWISPDQIYTDYMRQDTEDFYRYTLGAPFRNTSLAFRPSDVTNNVRPDMPRPVNYNGDGSVRYVHISMGVDWGQHFHHVIVMGMRENGYWDIINMFQIPNVTGTDHLGEDVGSVASLIQRFSPDIVCADNGFSDQRVLRLKQLFPEVVYGVNTRTTKSTGDLNAPFNENSHNVVIDKVAQTKVALIDIKEGKIGFFRPNTSPCMHIFINHWENVIIRRERDENNGQTYEVMPGNKQDRPDHFASATTYAIIAMREITLRLANGNSHMHVSSLNIGGHRKRPLFKRGYIQQQSKDIGPYGPLHRGGKIHGGPLG